MEYTKLELYNELFTYQKLVTNLKEQINVYNNEAEYWKDQYYKELKKQETDLRIEIETLRKEYNQKVNN